MRLASSRNLSLQHAQRRLYRASRQSSLSKSTLDQSREQIHRSEKLWSIFESAHIGVFDWDMHTTLVYFSPEWKRQIGYEPEEIRDDFSEWESRLHPDDQAAAIAQVYKSSQSGVNYQSEFRLRHKDGSYRWIMARGFVQSNGAGEPVRLLGCHIDITEQKQKAIDTSQSEMRFRGLAENSQDYIVLYDREFRHVYLNPATLHFMKKTEADVVGKTPKELGSYGETGKQWDADFRHVFATGQPIQRISEWQVTQGTAYLDWYLSPIFDEHGQVEQVLAIARDITSLKQTEKALRDSENRLRFALEGANDGLWDMDLRTNEFYISPRGCEILGYRPEEMAEVAKIWYQIVHTDDLPEMRRRLNEHIQGHSPALR